MASRLMKSVSGIRGVVGETMTPELVVEVGAAFSRFCGKGAIVLGRDSRRTGEAIADLVRSVLVLAGRKVIDCGIVPTPTVQVAVEEFGAAGGLVVSASHNPIQWNAFKLINSGGTFLNAAQTARLFSLMGRRGAYRRWNAIGETTRSDEAAGLHIRRVLRAVDVESIRRRRFRVALDSVNGAGSLITRRLLADLGCSVFPLHCEITGTFPRGAEPLPENLSGLSEKVTEMNAHVGFAQDPDADRLAIVDEKGRPIGEENTLSLVVEHLLSKKPGRVVVNLSTTSAVEDIARKYGSRLVRTRVGEIHVVEEMRRRGARIGGEGNGGVISPEVHLGRDSLAGIAYVLEMMAVRGGPLSRLREELPFYIMKKGKIDTRGSDPGKAIREIRRSFRGEKITDLDGLRVDFLRDDRFKGGWVHLRSSNTEPVFRIIAEGVSREQAARIYAHFLKLFR